MTEFSQNLIKKLRTGVRAGPMDTVMLSWALRPVTRRAKQLLDTLTISKKILLETNTHFNGVDTNPVDSIKSSKII